MTPYTIETGQPQRRSAVNGWLKGLELVNSELRELIITAWVSAWVSSTHDALEDMPYTLALPQYPLMRHVNEVTRTGLDLARRAENEWGETVDFAILVPVLILHDVDKPLLVHRQDGKAEATQLYRELPHGVIGAMLLHDLGFAHPVVSTVATHASSAPFHGETLEACVLYYADFFATDCARMSGGLQPFYQMRGR